MGVSIKAFNEVQPICNDCGVALCWSVDISEYQEAQRFWDEWCCRDCNSDYLGAYGRYRKEHGLSSDDKQGVLMNNSIT